MYSIKHHEPSRAASLKPPWWKVKPPWWEADVPENIPRCEGLFRPLDPNSRQKFRVFRKCVFRYQKRLPFVLQSPSQILGTRQISWSSSGTLLVSRLIITKCKIQVSQPHNTLHGHRKQHNILHNIRSRPPKTNGCTNKTAAEKQRGMSPASIILTTLND